MTADGALPVDFLEAGQRVLTRSGMRILRSVDQHRYSGPAICIEAGALDHNRPEQTLILPAHAPVMVPDWREVSLFGRKRIVVEAAALVNATTILPADTVSMRLYDLRFDAPEIVHAEGLELACLSVEGAALLAAE